VDVNGVAVTEIEQDSGAAWEWEPQPGIRFAIGWVRESGEFTSGAKYGDGGWTIDPIRTTVLTKAATLDEARTKVHRHLEWTPWLGG